MYFGRVCGKPLIDSFARAGQGSGLVIIYNDGCTTIGKARPYKR
jgi:hypothetical protein